MTGGDPITARFLHKNFFTYLPQFTLLIVGNHKPVLQNVDDAIRRRFNMIRSSSSPPYPNPRLEEELRAEWPSILRWMIDGCIDWQLNGLMPPAAVTEATETYFLDQDLFGQWLEEKCEVALGNPHIFETVNLLFESWNKYLVESGERPISKKSFSEDMVKRGFKRGTQRRQSIP